MIITCPNCQTKYEVADQAIGSAGRKVQCANCHRSWKATAPTCRNAAQAAHRRGNRHRLRGTEGARPPSTDRLFGKRQRSRARQGLCRRGSADAAADPEADRPDDAGWTAAGRCPPEDDEDDTLDHGLLSRRKRDLVRRQKKHASRLPLARIRRTMRMAALITLMTLVGMAYQFRVDIVRTYPDLGGLYAMVGINVNIYGLVFSNVETLRTLKDGADVTIITAKIRSSSIIRSGCRRSWFPFSTTRTSRSTNGRRARRSTTFRPATSSPSKPS